jgi:arsenate reductase
MAEGLVNHYLGFEWKAYSAGTSPAGYVHPMAVQVMNELGIDISTQQSKQATGFFDTHLDLVITVCDDAAENCPVWLGRGRRIHIGFDDPARATGTEMERLAVFRRVRDEIRLALFEHLVAPEWFKAPAPGALEPRLPAYA